MGKAKGKWARIPMTINGHKLNVSFAAYDGCHKIYLPMNEQEDLFIKTLEKRGYVFEEDFYRIESVDELMDMFLRSCNLRFIQMIDCSGDEDGFINIIPQSSFFDDEDFFDEELARKAFVSRAS